MSSPNYEYVTVRCSTCDTERTVGKSVESDLPDWQCGPCRREEAEERRRYEVCPRCEGHGKVVHPALSVWTESDRYEDPEGFESMMHGDYDVTCPECHGKRVVTAEDEQDYAERERDRRTRFMESGIYPGSRDWY